MLLRPVHWWALAIRGVLAVLFGLMTLEMPGITLLVLVLMFGAYALLDGVFDLLSLFHVSSGHWALLVEGLIGIGAGIVTIVWPHITGIALLWVIAFWALLGGVLKIAAGIRLRQVSANYWVLVVAGLLSALLGLLMIASPRGGALAVALWIGTYAIVAGLMMIGLAFRMRRFRQTLEAARAIQS